MGNEMDITTLLRELHNISGFRISLHDTDFNEIAAYPSKLSSFCRCIQNNPEAKKKCLSMDAEACKIAKETSGFHLYKCCFGLYEAVAPLYHFGVHSGYLMMGQITDDSPSNAEDILNLSNPYVTDSDLITDCISTIKSIPYDMIVSYIKIMTVCAEYITLTGKMCPDTTELASLVTKFINANYNNKISLDLLCRRFACSKTTLMNSFKAKHSMTVSTYITNVRLKKAKELLENTKEPMCAISDACGLGDQNYFSKIFIKNEGVTPTQYRKLHTKLK